MGNLKLEINHIRNISFGALSFPIEKGIYCLSGRNGTGKSTIMSCLAQSLYSSSLNVFNEADYDTTSFIRFSYDGDTTTWSYSSSYSKWRSDCPIKDRIHFNGMYEGSLFYGTRFNDSLFVDSLLRDGKLQRKDIVDADDYIKENLSYILHGNTNYYFSLKKVRNKHIAEAANLENTPYFQEFNGNLISQYRMSSGECLLISLLHFIYNALIRRSLPSIEPILMIVDEIELALHPVAVSRLIDLLNSIIEEHENLTVLLSSHSPEVIRKINPNNLFMLEPSEDSESSFQVVNPCYPSYAIRDVYMHDGFDSIILVEDILAKYAVDTIIKKQKLNSSKLINILPIGGWENVLKFQNEVYNSNTFGIGTKVFSVLDGDIESKVSSKYKRYTKLFLPINSVEKYLYKVITTNYNLKLKKEINDFFFNIESLDYILADYFKSSVNSDDDGKTLYKELRKNLNKRNISEDAFIKELCSIIMQFEDFSAFESSLSTLLT